MARRYFRELVTPFLQRKLEELAARAGTESPGYQALARQYLRTQAEDAATDEDNLRHYDADVRLTTNAPTVDAAAAALADGSTIDAHATGPAASAPASAAPPREHDAIPGVERLYRRTLVIEPTLACVAHCRYCIRANYPRHNLSNEQLERVARFCGSPANRDDLTEVLVTGGDVLLVPDRVEALVESLLRHAPNIRVARIATRIPVQDPARIDDDLLRLFRPRGGLRFELATQINHAVEFFPETIAAFARIMDRGVRVYAQNVLLRGVNDSPPALIELYDAIRAHGIESHYLFHCVPMAGMTHLRTTLREAIDLARGLSACGAISGRAKPMLAAMTDIGKIVLYEGTILARRGKQVLLRSSYGIEDRRRWNPGWELPRSAELDSQGRLRIWYLDGIEPDGIEQSAERHASPAGRDARTAAGDARTAAGDARTAADDARTAAGDTRTAAGDMPRRITRTRRPNGPWRIELPIIEPQPAGAALPSGAPPEA